jgi:hypothetical protein
VHSLRPLLEAPQPLTPRGQSASRKLEVYLRTITGGSSAVPGDDSETKKSGESGGDPETPQSKGDPKAEESKDDAKHAGGGADGDPAAAKVEDDPKPAGARADGDPEAAKVEDPKTATIDHPDVDGAPASTSNDQPAHS